MSEIKTEDREDTNIGGVTWHSSEEDGGPDVGLSVYLGDGKRLWCGEIPRKTFEDCSGTEWFADDAGWFLVYYDPAPRLLAKIGDPYQAREFIDAIAWMARDADVPSVAKMLSKLKS